MKHGSVLNQGKMNIIIDQDGSTDDIIAILYLKSHSNVNLMGITIAATGENRANAGVENITNLCYHFGFGAIPVASGPETPVSTLPSFAAHTPFPNWVRDTVDNILIDKNIEKHPDPKSVTENDAILLIQRIVSERQTKGEKVTILATGPLTNIALFVQRYPELINNIEHVVIMGGAINVPGNLRDLHSEHANKEAECNFIADPQAAHIVFSSGVPIKLIPLDITNQVPLSKEYYLSLKQSKNPAHNLMYLLLKDIHDKIPDTFFDVYFLWDPLAAMICLDSEKNPQIAQFKKEKILIDPKTAKTTIDPQGTEIEYAVKILHNPQFILNRLSFCIGENIKTTEQWLEEDLKILSVSYTPGYDTTALRALGTPGAIPPAEEPSKEQISVNRW